MSHLPLSLMNRLNKTEFPVFIFWMLYFQRIPFSDNLEITTSVVVPFGGPQKISPYIDLVLLYLHFLLLWGRRIHNVFESKVALNPGLGRMCHHFS